MSNYIRKSYYMMATEPVHIGIGGYRLGRVDMPIIRDAGTQLPKIPGTSLHGAISHYASYNQGGNNACAGQSGRCGKSNCPFCYTFGSASNNISYSDSGYAGVISTSDAHILFFPVISASGPVWISTKDVLREADIFIDLDENEEIEAWTSFKHRNPINLGWLMLSSKYHEKLGLPVLSESPEWEMIKNRMVIVKEPLFSRIVNSNLEIRTSISINPETGAADDSALFTYEAIPRSTFFYFSIVCDDYRNKFMNCLTEDKKTFESPLELAESGLRWIEYLGLGGMTNKGFGRIRDLKWKISREDRV